MKGACGNGRTIGAGADAGLLALTGDGSCGRVSGARDLDRVARKRGRHSGAVEEPSWASFPSIPARDKWIYRLTAGLLARGVAPIICLPTSGPGPSQWHGAGVTRRPAETPKGRHGDDRHPLTVAGAATVSAPIGSSSPCSLLIPRAHRRGETVESCLRAGRGDVNLGRHSADGVEVVRQAGATGLVAYTAQVAIGLPDSCNGIT